MILYIMYRSPYNTKQFRQIKPDRRINDLSHFSILNISKLGVYFYKLVLYLKKKFDTSQFILGQSSLQHVHRSH